MSALNGLTQVLRDEIPKLEGWLTPERAIELAELVVEHKPKVCVELGVFGARTTITMALALKQVGEGICIGVDPWKVEAAIEGENDPANNAWWQKVDMAAVHEGAMKAIWRLGLDQWALIVRARSEHCPMLFGMIGLLVIDGNHSEEASCRDVRLYLPMVVSGGHVLCDDIDWPTTQKAKAMIEVECDMVKSDGHYAIYRKR